MERDLNNIKESIGESYVVNRPRGILKFCVRSDKSVWMGLSERRFISSRKGPLYTYSERSTLFFNITQKSTKFGLVLFGPAAMIFVSSSLVDWGVTTTSLSVIINLLIPLPYIAVSFLECLSMRAVLVNRKDDGMGGIYALCESERQTIVAQGRSAVTRFCPAAIFGFLFSIFSSMYLPFDAFIDLNWKAVSVSRPLEFIEIRDLHILILKAVSIILGLTWTYLSIVKSPVSGAVRIIS